MIPTMNRYSISPTFWYFHMWPQNIGDTSIHCRYPLPQCFLARNAFVRTNHRAVGMMFAGLSVCLSDCLSGRAYIVIMPCTYSADLSLWLDSQMFWAPWHQSMSTYSQPAPFSSSTWKRGGVWISEERLKIGVKLLLSANRKSYMPRRLAQQRMTLSDLE